MKTANQRKASNTYIVFSSSMMKLMIYFSVCVAYALTQRLSLKCKFKFSNKVIKLWDIQSNKGNMDESLCKCLYDANVTRSSCFIENSTFLSGFVNHVFEETLVQNLVSRCCEPSFMTLSNEGYEVQNIFIFLNYDAFNSKKLLKGFF